MKKNIDYYFAKLQRQRTHQNFRYIYDLSSVRLFGVVLRILKRKELAEECLQEVYVKIWNRAHAFEAGKASGITWMSTIARNHAIDYLRKRNLPIQDDFEISILKDEQLHFLNQLVASDTHRQLQHCLGQLKAGPKTVIFMAYFQGLTYAQIAKTLRSPVSTVKTWGARALPVLKTCLEKIDD